MNIFVFCENHNNLIIFWARKYMWLPGWYTCTLVRRIAPTVVLPLQLEVEALLWQKKSQRTGLWANFLYYKVECTSDII